LTKSHATPPPTHNTLSRATAITVAQTIRTGSVPCSSRDARIGAQTIRGCRNETSTPCFQMGV
jgi:hypothetical protein